MPQDAESTLHNENGTSKKPPIFQNTSVCDCVYSPELSSSHLRVNEFVEISLVTEGNGIHRILNNTSECRAGDLYIISSGVSHGYFAKSTAERPVVLSLCFDEKFWLEGIWSDFDSPHFCYGVFKNKAPVSYAVLNSQALNEVKNIYRLIENEVTHKKLEWEEAVRAYLTLLLITVGRYINMEDTVQPIHIHPKEWVTVSAAMREALERCGDSNMTLESIAASLYVSKSHLSRLFQKAVGESFLDYVRSIRISRACSLLRNTSLTNQEIVNKCGMKDVPTFYRTFKASMGMTPYQYRISNGKSKNRKSEKSGMEILSEISENLQSGKIKEVESLVKDALSDSIPPARILNDGLLSGMNILGEKFKKNEVYVSQVLAAARAMSTGMAMLKPYLTEKDTAYKGRVCIGTVEGDLHDIGKNLVKMMMECKGLEVIDLGTDVSAETFVNTAIEKDCRIICCSALLTTTMDIMEDVVKCAEKAGIRDKVKIMIGGAPVTQEFCDRIGADCYTSDAASAADAAVELCKV